MTDSDGFMGGGKLILPASHQRVLGLNEGVQWPLAFCVHIRIHAPQSQDDQIPAYQPDLSGCNRMMMAFQPFHEHPINTPAAAVMVWCDQPPVQLLLSPQNKR